MTPSRIFLYCVLSFIAGIGIRSFISIPAAIVWFFVVGGLIVLTFGLVYKKHFTVIGAAMLVLCALGMMRYGHVENQKPDISRWYGASVVAEGAIVSEPRVDEAIARFDVEITAINHTVLVDSLRARVTVRRYPEFFLGDGIRMNGILEEPENFSDFDYVGILARDHVFATMRYPEIIRLAGSDTHGLRFWLARSKREFEERIETMLPEPYAAFLKGLLVGDRATLPGDLVEHFKTTGTTHIVALSGYNITLVGKFFLSLLAAATVPFFVSLWVATGTIILFVILTGASASVVRAGIMGVLLLLAEREGRPYRMAPALVSAAALMVLYNPFTLRFDIAFQLSFAATLGIIFIAPYFEKKFFPGRILFSERRDVRRGWREWIRHTFIETCAAQVAVLPLILYYFGQVSLISPLVNILILAAVPYTMAVGFIGAMAGFVSSHISVLLGFVTWFLLEYMIRVIELFARTPLAVLSLGRWVLIPISILYLLAIQKIWKDSKNSHRHIFE